MEHVVEDNRDILSIISKVTSKVVSKVASNNDDILFTPEKDFKEIEDFNEIIGNVITLKLNSSLKG